MGWGGGGRLFEVGANLRLGAYLNKYMYVSICMYVCM